MLYGERLKKLREDKELKQQDLANLLNIHKDVYGQYEREYVIIPTKHLNILCNYFNVSIDYIFGFNKIIQYENSVNDIDKIKSGTRLKEFRKKHNLTQKDVAKVLNTTNTVISGYEIGRRLIATPFLYTLCKKYSISADYLLGKID